MREIHIIDTSVFCEIMRIPNMSSNYKEALRELKTLTSTPGITILLPVATIYETGNHIAQNGSGRQRRAVAEIFSRQVQEAFNGQAPWTPTPIHNVGDMMKWMDQFPNYAESETGLGDLSIIKTFEQQCELNPNARVKIWSYDSHLSSYDRTP